MKTPAHTRTVEVNPDLQLTLTEAGEGRPVLIFHGGGGPRTVAPIANHLAQTAHTVMPTLPGWNGTPRPSWLTGVDDLALVYLQYLRDHGLRDVLVIGSSLGGWIAAEMAVRDNAGIISGLVLINAAGIAVEGEPIRDVFALDPRGIAELSFHDPAKFFVDPATLPPEQVAAVRANMGTLRVLSGQSMSDPKLMRRLSRVTVPALVVWGESDRIITPAYGEAYAKAFLNGRFEGVKQAGHLPQLEQPAATLALIDAFAASTGGRPA